MTKEERWYSTDAFVATCTAVAKITEATGGMVATIDEINTFQELLKQQGFSIFPKEYPNQDKWISVKDELPEDGEYVLGYYYNGCDIFQFNGGFFLINLNRNRDITHWQPLPNPPKQ